MNNIDYRIFENKRVLEVGSRYVNGSVRHIITKFCKPSQYIGVDIRSGPLVDIVLPAEQLISHFGSDSFDVVISTELLEHVRNWRTVIRNLKDVLKNDGLLFLTTRSKGFPYHAHPYDFWRYQIADIRAIFRDFEIIQLSTDPESPGIFLEARKQDNSLSIPLDDISLYSMLLGRRTSAIPDFSETPMVRKCFFKAKSYVNSFSVSSKRILSRNF